MGVLVNTAVIIAGGILGLFAKKGIPEKISKTIIKALALSVMFIGITGMFRKVEGYETNALITILSLVLGGALGEIIDIDRHFNSFSKKVENRMKKKFGENVRFTEGFVYASALFCIGAMGIIGPLDAGIKGDNTVLYAKSILDGISSVIYASVMGVGVAFSAVPVLLLEGGLFLLAFALSPVLTPAVVAEVSIVGSVIILAIGMNVLEITKIKIMNLLPAILLPLVFCQFM